MGKNNKIKSLSPRHRGDARFHRVFLIALLIGAILCILIMISDDAKAGQLSITSLPYALSQASHSADSWDTVTIAGSKLSTTGSGISVGNGCHNWYFAFGTDTVEFGTAGGLSLRGILVSGGNRANQTRDLIFDGGWITHPVPDAERCNGSYDSMSICMQVSGNNILVKNLRVRPDGKCGRGIIDDASYAGGHGYGVTFRNDTVYSDVRCWGARDNFLAAGFNLAADYKWQYADSLGYNFNYRLVNCYVYNNPGMGVRFTYRTVGYGVRAIIESSFVNVDALNNDSNLSPLSYDNHYSTVNSFCIQITHAEDSSIIRDNTLISGTVRGGSDGLHLNGRYSSMGGYAYVYRNRIVVNEGPNSEHMTGLDDPCMGMQLEGGGSAPNVRWYIGGYGDSANIVTVRTDENTGTSAYSMLGYPLAISNYGDTGYTKIYNNICSVYTVGTDGDNHALMIRAITESSDLSKKMVIVGNKFYSDKYLISFAYKADGGSNMLLEKDTFTYISPTLTGHHLSWMGTVGMTTVSATGNILRDCAYGNGAVEGDVAFANAGTYNIRFQQTLHLHVRDTTGTAVDLAQCYARSSYGNMTTAESWLGFTSGGNTQTWFTTGFYQRTGGDSTGFNPYQVSALKLSEGIWYGDTADFNLGPTNKYDTLTLPFGIPPLPPEPTSGQSVKGIMK